MKSKLYFLFCKCIIKDSQAIRSIFDTHRRIKTVFKEYAFQKKSKKAKPMV